MTYQHKLPTAIYVKAIRQFLEIGSRVQESLSPLHLSLHTIEQNDVEVTIRHERSRIAEGSLRADLRR